MPRDLKIDSEHVAKMLENIQIHLANLRDLNTGTTHNQYRREAMRYDISSAQDEVKRLLRHVRLEDDNV
jgi:hypothetical protein